MSAPTLERAGSVEEHAGIERFATPLLPLPDVFRARMTASDEPVHGELRDPSQALPGDYVLGESGNWLRVLESGTVADGRTLTVGRLPGIGLFVGAGRQVWVWRAADVLAWMVLGESAGAL